MKVESSPLGIASAVAESINQRQKAQQTEPPPAASSGVVVSLSEKGLALANQALNNDKSVSNPTTLNPQRIDALANASTLPTAGQISMAARISKPPSPVSYTSQSAPVPMPETTPVDNGYLGAIATNLATNSKSINQTQQTARKSNLKSIQDEISRTLVDPNLTEQEKQNKTLQISNELKAAEQSLKNSTPPKATPLTNSVVNHVPQPAEGDELADDPAKQVIGGNQGSFISKQTKQRKRQLTEQILQYYRAVEAS